MTERRFVRDHWLLGPHLKRFWFPSLAQYIRDNMYRDRRLRLLRLRRAKVLRRVKGPRDKERVKRSFRIAIAKTQSVVFKRLRQHYMTELFRHNAYERKRWSDWRYKRRHEWRH